MINKPIYKKIVCIGEVLWDVLPAGLFIGGAPFNTACHLNTLGMEALMISKVGDDILGRRAINKIKRKNLLTGFIQMDETYPTGRVNVSLDKTGNASYNIVEPSAWDFIDVNDAIINYVKDFDVLVYGTLAQRNIVSRRSIEQLRRLNKINVYDVNLRPPFIDPEIILQSLLSADIVKMNYDEFNFLADKFNLNIDLETGMRELSEKFNCKTVCVTKGYKGSAIYNNNDFSLHEGFEVKVKDTIGSGDAYLAAFLYGLFKGDSNQMIIEFANAVGAYVASKNGAVPKLNFKMIDNILTAHAQL
jgi:fructokinase